MKSRTYHCAQQELYTIANIAWGSASQHMQSFTDFKPKYNPAYIAARLAEIDNAMLIPSEDERSARSAILRIELTDANRVCLNKFQQLKCYIQDAFPDNMHDIEYMAAGQSHFRKATLRSWTSTEALLNIASRYIDQKLNLLSANQNMPVGFPAQFETDRAAFADLHMKFLDSEETATITAEEKIIMNNKIFNSLRQLFRDGQKIFRYEHAIRKQFIFTDLLYLDKGSGTAGLRGTITNAHTGQPVPNATLTIVQTSESDITSEKGKYQVSPMAHGVYSIRVVAEGYEEHVIPEQEVLVGTISTLNIPLSPVAAA